MILAQVALSRSLESLYLYSKFIFALPLPTFCFANTAVVSLSYLFSRAPSVAVSVFTSSNLSVGISQGLQSVLSVLGVLKPLHQPAPFSLCLSRAVYTAVSLVINPSPKAPSWQTGISTGPSRTSGSCTRGCGLSVGGSGDIGEWRRESGAFLPLERGLGYLQLGRAARGSMEGSRATRPPS